MGYGCSSSICIRLLGRTHVWVCYIVTKPHKYLILTPVTCTHTPCFCVRVIWSQHPTLIQTSSSSSRILTAANSIRILNPRQFNPSPSRLRPPARYLLPISFTNHPIPTETDPSTSKGSRAQNRTNNHNTDPLRSRQSETDVITFCGYFLG